MSFRKADGISSAAKSRSKQPPANITAGSTKRRNSSVLQSGGVILSLAGILICNHLGLGVGRAVCHGLLVAALGAPLRKHTPVE